MGCKALRCIVLPVLVVSVTTSAQDRWVEFAGGGLAAGLLICSAESPREVSALRYGLGVAGAVAGVYSVGRWICRTDGSWQHSLLGGGLGGVVGGLYLAHLHRTKPDALPGDPMMELGLSFVERFMQNAVLIVPPVLGAVLGFNRSDHTQAALLSFDKTYIQMSWPGFESQRVDDRFAGIYTVTRCRLFCAEF